MKTSARTDGWGVALLAFSVRALVSFWAWERVPPTADGKFYHVVAERIAQGDGYTWAWPDGAVTFAAHYPVGYPALMAIPYGLFGPQPGAMMLVNAAFGALAVWACHDLCFQTLKAVGFSPQARWGAFFAGLLLALSPTLVGYTPALMTEGAVGAVLSFSAWLAFRAVSERRLHFSWFVRVALGLCLGVAVLLRPQSVLFAPVLGALSARGNMFRRLAVGLLVSLATLAVVMPWTLRNCDKMERCVFVSANGGWNLLIGTFPEGNGAWVALDGERVPVECREVFQEAAKDRCFAEAGTRRVAERPLDWLGLIPAKLRATFDHTAAASDHLAESGALGERGKRALKVLEYLIQRLSFVFAAAGAYALALQGESASRRVQISRFLLGAAVLGFLGLGASWGWIAVLSLILQRPAGLSRVAIGWGAFAVFSTMVVHGVFFGAGRYALPLLFSTAPLTALGAAFLHQRSYASRRSPDSNEV